jgi:hypothetical protein
MLRAGWRERGGVRGLFEGIRSRRSRRTSLVGLS